MTLTCRGCRTVILKEDRRFKVNRLQPRNGARLEQRVGMAPRLVCRCGVVTILLEGRT